jgi:type VI secretion system secreted protein VgrG
MPWTQKDRLLSVDTPLGKDVLLLTEFKGVEGISRPFNFELAMVSENHKISFEAIVGKKATVTIRLADGGQRYFNGYIASFSQGRGGGEDAADPRFSFYRATLVPGFWLHTRVANLRVFSEDRKGSVPEIVEKIVNEKGFQDLSNRLTKDYKKREYCLQYRETDFSFISRLLEEEGIYYFFEHSNGNHTMVLADDPDKHQKCPNQARAKYQISAGGWLEEDVITALEKTKEIRPGKYTLNDYDFRKPAANLKVEVPTKQKLEPKPDRREVYDFSGKYVPDNKAELQRSEGDRLANIRMEDEEAGITTITGSSVCRAFATGYRFTLLKHYRGDITDKDYVLTEIHHEAKHVAEYPEKSVPDNEPQFAYLNHFTCIPHEIPYRPPRVTPKPIVHGSETATVVGPSGAKSHTDFEDPPPKHYGMVRIQFHWDREGKKDENSSCWVRVAYPYAGRRHGAQFTPLIGDEVMVDFLQGDPDKPVVTGSLFKGEDKSLIKPEKMIKNEILTPYGHSLHFDDKGAHITLKTGGGEVINMAEGKEDKTDYGNNIKIYTADGHRMYLAQGNLLKGIDFLSNMGHRMTFDDRNDCIKVLDRSAQLSIFLDSKTGQIRIGNDTVAGGGWILLECPNGKISQKAKDLDAYATQSITIDAMTKLTLKCGASSIEMTPGTITIKSPMVKINC